jgi:hypothetical protein
LNLVPADAVPLPDVTPAAWAVCGGEGGATICRLVGLPFYALTVQGPERKGLALTLATLHRRFREWGTAYNLLGFGTSGGHEGVRLAVVPRAVGDSAAVDQRLAGLEFLTGVLIPGPKRTGLMSLALRDQAFQETTLHGDQRLDLERRLRAAFGPPPAGVAVVAVPQAG